MNVKVKLIIKVRRVIQSLQVKSYNFDDKLGRKLEKLVEI